ncbi:MAG: DUF3108 domain-containing protein [Deferrisomatales bacterium]|nr:DUF3108 domain-containing protein [Deferrisomatales bacterium]
MFRSLVSLILVLLAVQASPALGPPPSLEALQGENLEFDIRWGIIPAARASLEVTPGGDGLVTLRAKARTLPYIDTVFPVRDLVESTVRLADLSVLRFYKKTREGRSRSREDEAVFDPETGEVQSFRRGKPRGTLLAPPGVQDPLSSFYAFRTMALTSDDTVSIDITDGNRLVTGTVSVLKRETVKTPAGTFRTVLVEPHIEGVGGVFRRSPGARVLIWLTDDGWRRPVRLQSAVAVGSFTAELTRIVHPAPLPRDPG